MFIHNGKPTGDDALSLQGVEINVNQYKQLHNKFTSTSGTIKYKAQQQYKNVDIFGATMVIQEDESNNLSPLSGSYYQTDIISSDFNDDVTPSISKEEALQIKNADKAPKSTKLEANTSPNPLQINVTPKIK